MIKNFGKLKQWTGERLGAAKMTLQTEDFQQLEADTERKRTGFEKVYSASELVHGQLSKKKPSPEDNKTKVYPIQAWGEMWSNHGMAFSEDSPLGAALSNLGEIESRIAMLQEELCSIIKDDYMATLEVGLHEYKEYQSLRKKLESRRLDYDAKMGRLQKAKKEKPEWEQEMQASKLKYEETEYDLIQKMVYLQDYEDTHLEALRRVLEAQFTYHSHATELLNNMRTNWDSQIKTLARQTARSPYTNGRSVSASPASTPLSYQNDDYFYGSEGGGGLSTMSQQRRPSVRQGSQDSLGIHPPRRVPSSASIRSTNSEPRQPPPMPRRQSQQQQQPATRRRKAMYDFDGESLEELSFRAGDVITVVEEVDEGWWLGEVEHIGPKRRGIFPVNYTEEITAHRSPPTPARPVIHEEPHEEEVAQDHYYQQQQQVYSPPPPAPSVQEDSPFSDHQPSAYTSPPRPAMPSRSSSSVSTPPMPSRSSTFVPLDTKPTAAAQASRTPPPPPASRVSPSVSNSTRRPPPPPVSSSSPQLSTSGSSMRLGPQAHARAVTPAATTINADVPAQPDCHECGCDDFSPNVFKKGHCNNCFHKHQ